MQRDERQFDGSHGGLATRLGLLILAAAFAVTTAGCGADSAAGDSCTDHEDCEFGKVCGDNDQCVEAECDFCQDVDGLICVESEDLCTAPCQTDDDCPDAQCIDGVCGGQAGGCDGDEDCPEGQSCHPVSNTCTESNDTSGDCTSDEDCGEGETCQDNSCVPDDQCDLQAGDCEGDTPHLDEENCECVECTDTSQCDGELECTNGSCSDPSSTECESCDPESPGDCGGDKPYCIDECCVECIGAGDCEGNEVCTDAGFCEQSGSCSTDDDCPSGYVCDGGDCSPAQSGSSCNNDDDCPDGQFCNPETDECESLGGGAGCGMCNDDCTCDGNLTCDGFVCTGCTWLSGHCASDECCYPLSGDFSFDFEEGMCVPESMCPDLGGL